MTPLRELLFFVVFSFFFATTFAVDCWNPNGSNRNEDSDVPEGSIFYQPCSLVTKFSMCCRSPQNGGDSCLENGLCQGYNGEGSQPIWRESCTDPTWNSPYCLNFCTTGRDETGFPRQRGDSILIQCANGSFCCGQTNTTCCDRGEGRWIETLANGYQIRDTDPKLDQPSTTSSSSSSTSSSPTTASTLPSSNPTPITAQTTTQQPLPSPPPEEQSSSASSTNPGAIAGGVIAGLAALVLLIAAIWLFRRRRRRAARIYKQQQQQLEQEQQAPPHPAMEEAYQPRYRTVSGVHEADPRTDRKDLSPLDGVERVEIGGGTEERDGRGGREERDGRGGRQELYG